MKKLYIEGRIQRCDPPTENVCPTTFGGTRPWFRLTALLAMSKLPANALGGYTSAIGSIFDGLRSNFASQASAESNHLKVLSAAQKISQCQLAIAINNTSLKADDPTALATAFSNILAACPNAASQ